MGVVRIGVSGWSYPAWRGDFYPAGLVQRRELEHLSRRVTSVEVNGSFYSLQHPDSWRRWRDQVPDDFVLAVKGSRHLTHMLRLVDADTALANFLALGLLALGRKLGPVLWQLPERMPCDPDVLDTFLGSLPASTAAAARLTHRHDDRLGGDRVVLTSHEDRPLRHALEARHPSFAEPAALDVLRRHGVACVLADAAGRWPAIDADTADFRYVRLHGHSELYASGYAARSLNAWAERCRAWAVDGDVYVYFDNDARGRAPHDAVALLDRLSDQGASSSSWASRDSSVAVDDEAPEPARSRKAGGGAPPAP